MFRAAHSLKGAAGSMGFVTVATLAHKMESLLEEVRGGQRPADRPMIDLLCPAWTCSRPWWVRSPPSPFPIPTRRSCATPWSLPGAVRPARAPGAGLHHPAPLPRRRSRTVRYRITVALDPQLPMKDVKAFLILSTWRRSAPSRSAIRAVGGDGRRIPGSLEVVGRPRRRRRGCAPPATWAACCTSKSACCRPRRSSPAAQEPLECGNAAARDSELNLPRKAQEALRQALTRGPVVYAAVHVRADSVLPEARNYLVFNNLKKAGTLIWSEPEAARLEAGYAGRQTRALIAGATAAAVERACNVAEVERAEVRALPSTAAAPSAAPVVAAVEVSPTPASPTPRPTPGPLRHDTIRVDVRKLDVLMDEIGELVTQRSRFAQLGADFRHYLRNLRLRRDAVAPPVLAHLKALEAAFSESLEQFSRLSGRLQESVMDVRMVPIGSVFNRFPRMVRDLGRELGKEVRLEISGGDTEVDRSVIEEIGDPLVHLIRNALDHGVEEPAARLAAGKPREARLELRASQQGNRIMIEVRDDGRGIDCQAVYRKAVEKGLAADLPGAPLSTSEALNLIFLPGFSTAGKVSDISGRGVGLDVVRRNVERVSGTIEVESQPGQGATFRIRLPLTLAIVHALLVRAGETVYALPLAAVEEIHQVPAGRIQLVREQEVVPLRDGVAAVYGLPGGAPLRGGDPNRPIFVAAVQWSRQRVGLAVDRFLGQEEVVIKPLGRYLSRVPGLAGLSVLGDGRVALVLDVAALLSGLLRPHGGEVRTLPSAETA
ncbi:chemotaxis protein CheA [bacterium]|nr:chemotaxis protein CheA [bacterium]